MKAQKTILCDADIQFEVLVLALFIENHSSKSVCRRSGESCPSQSVTHEMAAYEGNDRVNRNVLRVLLCCATSD